MIGPSGCVVAGLRNLLYHLDLHTRTTTNITFSEPTVCFTWGHGHPQKIIFKQHAK